MDRDLPATFLARLCAHAEADGVFPLVQSGAYRLRAVRCDSPFLVLPLAGRKRVHLPGAPLDCAVGSFAFWQQPSQLDVENIPDAGGDYRALVIPFSWALVELARGLLDRHQPLAQRQALVVSGPVDAIAGALDELIGETVDALAREHRLLGLLLALARAGHDGFRLARNPSFAERIRSRIAAEPARAWTSALLEAEFSVSGATLRRRLAEDDCSLRGLLREARLHHGLSLLQTSRKPLKAIAQDSGYRSATQFAQRFTERFGVAPSVVLNRAR
ncbi:helix-turn-helix transcriptional regulator [Niveibacterium terrae]|uniref:helix-turn-helix transcriptional regulator n=1 Tax=Niveibacterium terrae TaxID=3373598 RepID=UPI003A92593B